MNQTQKLKSLLNHLPVMLSGRLLAYADEMPGALARIRVNFSASVALLDLPSVILTFFGLLRICQILNAQNTHIVSGSAANEGLLASSKG